MNAESDDERIREIKKEGYGTRWERFKFAAPNYTLAIIGGLVLLFAWLNHEPSTTEPWKSDIGNLIIGMLLYGMFFYYFYLRNMHKLQRRIDWLEMMLRAVNSHAESMRRASINDDLDLQTRLDSLRGK